MKAITKTFKAADLREMELPDEPPEGGKIISDRIVGKSRWSVRYELIVHFPDQPDGEAWLMHYSVGATESQDEGPWEHDEWVKATLVREREVTVKQWVLVDAEAAGEQGHGGGE